MLLLIFHGDVFHSLFFLYIGRKNDKNIWLLKILSIFAVKY